MGAIVDETINHSGRCHVIGGVHENGTKTSTIEKLCVEVKHSVVFFLCGPVHSQHDGLRNEGQVAIGEQSKYGGESIGRSFGTLSKMGVFWEHAGLAKDASNVVLPIEVGSAVVGREVDIKFEAVVSSMTLC
jgi:hypothetical protein